MFRSGFCSAVDGSWRSAGFVGLWRSAAVGGRLLGFAFDCRLAGCRGWRLAAVGGVPRLAAVGGVPRLAGCRGCFFFIYRTHSRFASVRPIITFLFSIQPFSRRVRSAFNHISIQLFPRLRRSSFTHISIQPFPRRGRLAFNPISVQSSFKTFFRSFLLTLSSSTWSFRYFTSLSDCKVIEGYGRMDAKRE